MINAPWRRHIGDVDAKGAHGFTRVGQPRYQPNPVDEVVAAQIDIGRAVPGKVISAEKMSDPTEAATQITGRYPDRIDISIPNFGVDVGSYVLSTPFFGYGSDIKIRIPFQRPDFVAFHLHLDGFTTQRGIQIRPAQQLEFHPITAHFRRKGQIFTAKSIDDQRQCFARKKYSKKEGNPLRNGKS